MKISLQYDLSVVTAVAVLGLRNVSPDSVQSGELPRFEALETELSERGRCEISVS